MTSRFAARHLSGLDDTISIGSTKMKTGPSVAALPATDMPSSSDQEFSDRCRLAIETSGRYPDVRIDVHHGWVRLSGSVPLAAQRWKVEEAVGKVPGLLGVSAQITCPNGGKFDG